MRTIYICDDNASILEVTTIVLEEAGYKVKTFMSGVELRDAVLLHAPDLILVDMLMPIMDGKEVSMAIKANEKTRHVRVVIMSASQQIEKYVREAQADDSVAKPFDIAYLLAVIKRNLPN